MPSQRGAEVVLVAGGTVALADPPGIRVLHTESALAMREAVLQEAADAAVVIKAAAVADYRPKERAKQKIKKNDAELTLVLEKNPDILMELGARKRETQILVGFAAETQNLLAYAQEKLKKKNLDLIVANDLVKIIGRDGSIKELPLLSRQKVAKTILDAIESLQK